MNKQLLSSCLFVAMMVNTQAWAADAQAPAAQVNLGKNEAAKAATDGKAEAAGKPQDSKPADAAKAPEAAAAATPAPTSEPAKANEAKAEPAKVVSGPVVEFKTTEGIIKIEVDEKAAPISAKNFLTYVSDKFYDGTVFHRVIDGFVIQGGGYAVEGDKLVEKKNRDPIANEAKNGLKNDRGTLSMARTSDPNSATSQFFINLVDNERLNYPNPDGHGYAVFAKVIEGMDVVDRIAKTKTGFRGGMGDVPLADIKVLSSSIVGSKAH